MFKKLKKLFPGKNPIGDKPIENIFTGENDPRDVTKVVKSSDLQTSNPEYFFNHVQNVIVNLKNLPSINLSVSTDLSNLQGAFTSWRKNFNSNNISIKKIENFFNNTIKNEEDKTIYNFHTGHISRLNSYFLELLKICNNK
jgi:hypothetical protein